jgi:hypothetical protein
MEIIQSKSVHLSKANTKLMQGVYHLQAYQGQYGIAQDIADNEFQTRGGAISL